MVIEYNGQTVTLPDIPADVLAEYPYWTICTCTHINLGLRHYSLAVDKTQFGFVSEQLATPLGAQCNIIGALGYGVLYFVEPGGTEWELGDEESAPVINFECEAGKVDNNEYSIIASNHDIKVVESIDASYNVTWSDEIYFIGTHVEYESEYSAPSTWFVAMADQARRLSGVNQRYDRDEMLGVFEGVESGIKTKIIQIVPWSTGTDEQIAAMVAALDAGEISIEDTGWSIGDERTVTLSAMAATGVRESHLQETVTFVLMDSRHYDLVEATANGNTKDHFVVGMKHYLADEGNMHSNSTDDVSWDGCARRAWCNTVYRNAIPETLRGCFKQFKVNTATSYNSSTVTESHDYFALFAEKEVFGTSLCCTANEAAVLSRIKWYETAENRQKKIGDNGTTQYSSWFFRSPYTGGVGHFCRSHSSDKCTYARAYDTYGISPFGCI